MGSTRSIVLLVSLSTLFIHFAANSSASSSTRCRESEWKALMEFKTNLTFLGSRLSSWTGRDCCSWHGITCHDSTGHVQMLKLSDEYSLIQSYQFMSVPDDPSFSPRLSPWLFNLTHLQFLSLPDDFDLQGPIPNMFEKLTSLIHLNLSGNLFNSPLPDSLCSLTSLSELHLRNSELKGPLPPCLGNMTSLTIMDLGGNELSGKIPCELGNLARLTQLDLGSNRLNSSIPSTLGNLSKLEALNLGSNQLSGEIPSTLGHLSKLEALNLGSNQLSGEIPSTLGHLSKLEALNLGSNQLSGEIPSTLGNLTKLTWLSFTANSLIGELSESFFEGLNSLETLQISENKFIVLNLSSQWIPTFQIREMWISSFFVGTQFPPWLQTQRNLEWLDMSNTSISGDIPEWFQTAFPSLARIDLSNNLLTGSIPTFHSTSLLYLKLSGNRFSGNIPQALCNLRSIENLSLGNNQLTGTIPSCLGSLHNLIALDLGDNNLSGHIPKELGSLRDLTILHLNGNKLSGEFPESLLKLESLRTLDLGENELQGSIPQWIGMKNSWWPDLQFLRLESNNISGDIPLDLCLLDSLHILNLALNNFVGTIPPCLGNLSTMSGESGIIRGDGDELLNNMKGMERMYGTFELLYANFISLSGNHLHGQIPVELMNLIELQSLNLSNNELTGMIPETINNLINLESLDLSGNQLSGNIPQSLTMIDALSYLNLSSNNLTGRIPSGNHFDTLENPSIYGGNAGLCGKPLMKSCPGDHSAVSNQPNGPDSDGDDDEFDQLSWMYAGIGPGFAIGFLGAICTLYFKDKWRVAFFGFVDTVYNKVMVTFTIKMSDFRRKFN